MTVESSLCGDSEKMQDLFYSNDEGIGKGFDPFPFGVEEGGDETEVTLSGKFCFLVMKKNRKIM